jgi:hypothetical protein
MPQTRERRSPDGRRINIRAIDRQAPPDWIVRRRRAYRLIDRVADSAKRLVRRWLAPRPTAAPSQRPMTR